MNTKVALGLLILATAAWAQENSAALSQAGCGPDQARFNVKREAHAHPTGAPEPGKALVYVFGDSELDNASIHIGGWSRALVWTATGKERMNTNLTCTFRSLLVNIVFVRASSLL